MTRHLLLVAVIAACAPRTGELEDPPSIATDEGRRAVWRDLARWYIDNKAPDQALEMVKRVRDTGYDDDELSLIQARAMLAQGMPDEARVILEAQARKHPKDHDILGALGIVYSDLGLYDQAVEVLTTAVAIDDQDAVNRNNLGFILLGLGRCEEAKAQLEAVLSLDPTQARYRNNLAFALVCLGEHQRALKLFRTTLPEAEARYNMGIAYERLDRVPSAILQYREVLAISPDHAGARDALSRLAPLETAAPTEGPR